VDFTFALAFQPADRSFERGLARRAFGSNRGKNPYHLQGANGTDKNVMASVHKFPAVKTGRQGEFGAGS
jgi:hypothetical protein